MPVLLLALAGCAKEPPAATPRPPATGATASTGASPLGPIELLRPSGDAEIPARADARGGLRATMPIAGRAAPYQTLRVVGNCPARPCSAVMLADPQGSFRGVLTVTTTFRSPRLRLVARYVNPAAASTAARRVVRLEASAVREATRRAALRRAVSRRARTRARAALQAEIAAARKAADVPAAPAVAPPGDLLVVGDSLAVGTQAPLAGLLTGWTIRTDARIGRPLAEGMERLRELAGRRRPDVAVVSLFTNDDPTASGRLTTAVRGASALAGCTVWLTIVRPPLHGVPYDAANAALARVASARIRIVDWAGAVAARPAYLAPDGVHGTPAGYAARAQLVADAVRSCPRG